MTPSQLFAQIQQKRSFLCVGLDTDIDRIPQHLLTEEDPVFEFNRQIIDATLPYAIAYKPNLAFYEALGAKGLTSLQRTLDYLPADVLTIADAKRGDIGNTAERYAKAFFDTMNFDAVTVTPYMGRDAITPFLSRPGKWAFALALTSNAGAADFQYHTDDGEKLYERVLKRSSAWGESAPGELGFVVGATRAEALQEVRALVPKAFFLVPGVGAQGGDLEAVCRMGKNEMGGLLINSSRGIIYAGSGKDFAKAAGDAAFALQSQMAGYVG